MRVKTPWIDALTQMREAQKPGPHEDESIKRDVTPKKMSDSYYSAVRMKFLYRGVGTVGIDWLIDSAFGARQMAFGFLSQFLWAYSVRI